MSDLWSDGQEKYIHMKLEAWSFMGAFFSILIGCGVKNFGSQTPWSKKLVSGSGISSLLVW
jgi:hypothetical protein